MTYSLNIKLYKQMILLRFFSPFLRFGDVLVCLVYFLRHFVDEEEVKDKQHYRDAGFCSDLGGDYPALLTTPTSLYFYGSPRGHTLFLNGIHSFVVVVVTSILT